MAFFSIKLEILMPQVKQWRNANSLDIRGGIKVSNFKNAAGLQHLIIPLKMYRSIQIYYDVNPIYSLLLWHGWVFKIIMTLFKPKTASRWMKKSGFSLVSMGLERHFFVIFFFSRQNHQCCSFQNWYFLQFLKPWFQIWTHQLEISYTKKEHVGVCFSLKYFFF